jgi:hypothetical protein
MSSSMGNDADASEVAELRRRLELLEADNQRLREKLEPVLGPDNPCFDPRLFQRLLQRYLMVLMIPVYILPALTVLLPLASKSKLGLPRMDILGVRLLDFGGAGTRHPGIGIGIVALGGVSVGVIGIGGVGTGIFAFGGGAVGVVAMGGGSLGLIAIGGGSVGLIAVGGGACGRYALGQRGAGKYVLALNRQDDEAIEFFCRYMPRLRNAVTRPMPVIPPAA